MRQAAMANLTFGGPHMRSRWFILFLLLTSLAFAQSKPAQPSAPKAPVAAPAPSAPPAAAKAAPATTPTVPDNATVLTINGICDPSLPDVSKVSTPCKTQITKAEFDQMMTAIVPPGAPPLAPAMKRERATQLSQLMAVAAAGEKNGIAKTPEGEQMMKLAKLQALANAYARHLQQTSKPTDSELQAYYNANPDKFQQAKIEQLFVPPLKPAEGKPADAAAQKERADKFRQRAIAGEPFEKLEKEAIEGTQFTTPPPVEMTVQKENVPPARMFIFDLKDGEFSQVITEPSGSVIYKMVSKATVPLADVKDSLAQRLQQEKYQAALESILKSATPTLNDDYFGPATPEATPGGPMPAPPTIEKSPTPTPAPSPKQPQ
jgi:parvulin-like peptidyl-prolyl isomerase